MCLAERLSMASRRAEEEDKPVAAFSFAAAPSGNSAMAQICFGHLMQRVDSLENTLMLGGIGGSKKRGRQRTRWLDGITNSMV